MPVKPIPGGFHTLTPGCAVRNSAQAIDFYKRAFGARERSRFAGPDGTVVHAELEIGDSVFMLGEAIKAPPHAMQVMMYVDDCDAVYKRAVSAGAVAKEPVTDQFWGDRAGRVKDPFGNEWYIATHKEDVSEAEMQRRFREMMTSAPAK